MSGGAVDSAFHEIQAAKAIKDGIAQVTEDGDAIRDTLEGETDLHGVIRRLLMSIGEDDAAREGLDEYIRALDGRSRRLQKRIDAKRELIRVAMETAEWTSRELDVATVTMAKAAPALAVTDEASIPAKFWKTGKPSLDKRALLDALKAEELIPGCELRNGAPVLNIRRA